MSASSNLEVRNIRFDLDGDIPKYWHGGRRSVTIFFNALSILFPEGERFFIHSVKGRLDKVSDSKLRADARAFMGQEGIHGREHEKYNELVASQGYSVEKLERSTTWLLNGVKKLVWKRGQLSATAAFEHFTAILANLILRDPKLLEGVHPTMAALWRWHAAEENEHKCVAYDVYIQTGSNWFERTFTMLLVTLGFWGKVIEHQIVMMHDDGILFSPREWYALVKYLFWSPGGMHLVFLEWLHYFKPGFHPMDLDVSELLENWKKDYATLPEYRKV